MKTGRVSKKYRYIEHLSDIGLEFFGNTVEELFENAGEGMFSIICDLKDVVPVEKRKVRLSLESGSFEDLLVSWLEKLLYWHEVDNILFGVFEVKSIYEKNRRLKLSSEVSGEKIDTKKHIIKTAVKAPTYHMLEIKKNGRCYKWKGEIIFDV
jgi:SHS2 domain-containing protein